LGALAVTLLVVAVRGTDRSVGRDAGGAQGIGSGGEWPGKAAVVGALVLGALMVAVAPQAFGMPYPAAVAVQAVLAVGLAAATTAGRVRWWVVACALVAGVVGLRAAVYAFGSEPAT